MPRWRKKLPFRELGIGLKMLRGWRLNRARHITPFRELELPHGSLQLVDGIPLVRVRGTHREMGRALGTLVGVQAAETFHSYMRCFAPDFRGDLALAREMEPNLPPWLIDEMRGFAETSELSYDEMLVGQCFLDIHKVAACSTIAAHGKFTRDGQMLLGRNLDFPSLNIADEANIVVVYEPEGAGKASLGKDEAEHGDARHAQRRAPYRYAGVTWPGFLGILTGLNDAGLALSMMLVYGQSRHEHLTGQPFPTVFRRLLHECATVRQADALLSTKPYCTATNLILGDCTGQAARFQLHPRQPIVEYTSDDCPAIACTNHYHDRRIKGFAFTWFSSVVRYNKIAKRIQAGQVWDDDAIKASLQATGIPAINLQRTIMRPGQGSMAVSFENNGRGPGRWVELPRELLFGETATQPVSMPEAAAVAG
ncbi:MAG: hypothetical protein KF696_11850 [Planctomycetes bacterium]|nr:hypothetical protein [Planctomycetota bacterium]MCW8136981.1 hypothetical protein [Planctomycetota bacterium]